LREEVLAAALRMLDESADHQALSLRAVAREVGIAATSIYIHFADRDALVLAALERAHGDLMESVQHAADGAPDPDHFSGCPKLGAILDTAGEAALTTKPATGEELESDRLKAKLGAALIERDLLYEKIAILEAHRPLARRKFRP